MAQPTMTYRPQYDNDDDEAPPPYEASPSTNTGSVANPPAAQIAAHQHHQQYSVLTNSPYLNQHANDGTTPAGPPPPSSYYPDMNATPLYPQHPVLTLPAPHNSFYTVATSIAPPPHSQAYPSTPFQTFNGSVPRPYPTMQEWQPQPQQSNALPTGIPSRQSFPPQVQGYNVIDLDDSPCQSVAVTAPTMVSPRLSSPVLSPPLPAPISTTAYVLASTLSSQSTPTVELPELVTIYKCRKCGATLESETAVCRRIHTLTVKPAEWQAREVTEVDLEERRQYQERSGQLSLSLMSSSSTSAPSDGSAFAQVPSSIFFTHASVHASHPAPILSPLPVPSLAHAHIPVVSPKNNHGTDDIYLRRSISVQNTVTTLKKLWRDAKGELKRRQLESTQYEVISPLPLHPHPETHLVASMHNPPPTPSPHTYSHAPPQAVPAMPPVQPWLAPSSAPPRSQFWD